MKRTPIGDIIENLEDPEFARLYGEEDARTDFAITLFKSRKKLNLTQRELAEKLGVSQPYVARLESGDANPTLGKIGSLLAALGLRLVTGTAPLEPEPSPESAVIDPTGNTDSYPEQKEHDTYYAVAESKDESYR